MEEVEKRKQDISLVYIQKRCEHTKDPVDDVSPRIDLRASTLLLLFETHARENRNEKKRRASQVSEDDQDRERTVALRQLLQREEKEEKFAGRVYRQVFCALSQEKREFFRAEVRRSFPSVLGVLSGQGRWRERQIQTCMPTRRKRLWTISGKRRNSVAFWRNSSLDRNRWRCYEGKEDEREQEEEEARRRAFLPGFHRTFCLCSYVVGDMSSAVQLDLSLSFSSFSSFLSTTCKEKSDEGRREEKINFTIDLSRLHPRALLFLVLPSLAQQTTCRRDENGRKRKEKKGRRN